jgi:hypothetical protein
MRIPIWGNVNNNGRVAASPYVGGEGADKHTESAVWQESGAREGATCSVAFLGDARTESPLERGFLAGGASGSDGITSGHVGS